MDEFLKLFNLPDVDYERMTPDERKTFNEWVDDLENNRLTPDKIREHIQTMLRAVEQKFVETDERDRKHLYLKARMENYLLILAMFEAPEKARKQIEISLKRVGK